MSKANSFRVGKVTGYLRGRVWDGVVNVRPCLVPDADRPESEGSAACGPR